MMKSVDYGVVVALGVEAILVVSLLLGALLGRLGATPERRRDVLIGYAVLFVGVGILGILLTRGWKPDGLGIFLLTGVILAVLRGILWLVHLYD
jgi:hypothetical protein